VNVYIQKSLAPNASRIKENLAHSPVLYFLLLLVVVLCVFSTITTVAWLLRPELIAIGDLAPEVFGFMLDILFFGVLLSLYDRWRERRNRIRTYQEELSDYMA
jgi:hypothetical protein